MPMLSTERYLDRIGHGGGAVPSEAALIALHAAHAQTIPFENLDIHLGRPISGEVAVLFDKMVLHRRGGYCFEQNGLFGAMLEEMGFHLRPLLGRTTFGSSVPRPRGHLLNLVEIGSRHWLADVGFGGHGLIEPVPFEIGRVHRVEDNAYRVTEAPGGGFELSMADGGAWKSLYWFDRSPCYPVDVELVNF